MGPFLYGGDSSPSYLVDTADMSSPLPFDLGYFYASINQTSSGAQFSCLSIGLTILSLDFNDSINMQLEYF